MLFNISDTVNCELAYNTSLTTSRIGSFNTLKKNSERTEPASVYVLDKTVFCIILAISKLNCEILSLIY